MVGRFEYGWLVVGWLEFPSHRIGIIHRRYMQIQVYACFRIEIYTDRNTGVCVGWLVGWLVGFGWLVLLADFYRCGNRCKWQ
jgi:hypothetical protein